MKSICSELSSLLIKFLTLITFDLYFIRNVFMFLNEYGGYVVLLRQAPVGISFEQFAFKGIIQMQAQNQIESTASLLRYSILGRKTTGIYLGFPAKCFWQARSSNTGEKLKGLSWVFQQLGACSGKLGEKHGFVHTLDIFKRPFFQRKFKVQRDQFHLLL